MKLEDLKQLLGRIDALPRRDRMALLGGGLALLAGIEFQFVLALHDKRVSFVRQQQEPARAAEQAKQAEAEQKRARLAQVQKDLADRSKDLAGRGVSLPPQAVFSALRKTLSLQGLQVLSLEALPDDDTSLVAAPSAADAAAPAEAASDVVNATAAAASIYKHRAELRVAGSMADVSRALRELSQPNLPMQLDRVRLAAHDKDPNSVQATLVLVTISQERTWLAM